MTSGFTEDHFSDRTGYGTYRPEYPDGLFAWLAERAPSRRLVWDVACGTGQASAGLSRHFDRVVATDASEDQLARATPVDNVAYHVAPAERSPLEDGAADLVTVAQAYHWFDFAPFHAEARRVLREDGVLAVWSYGRCRIDPGIDAVVNEFHDVTLSDYWPAKRRHVLDAYVNLPVPVPRVETGFAIGTDWSFERFVGYVGTWSSVHAWDTRHGSSPLPAFRERLAVAWGDVSSDRRITWPLSVFAGRLD